MNRHFDTGAYLFLCETLSKITDPGDMRIFLDDLCTINELKQMASRLECAKQMLKGGTYNQIIEKTDISSATLSRVSRCLRYGGGGYAAVLAALLETEKTENGENENGKNENSENGG